MKLYEKSVLILQSVAKSDRWQLKSIMNW